MRWGTRCRVGPRSLVWLAVAALLFALGTQVSCTSDESDIEPAGSPPVASLLAVGDTGQPWTVLPHLFEGQLAVGAAMQREHDRLPVDALVLLGDNFYPNGLVENELIRRIVQNVARPYCAFIDPSPELVAVLGGDCSSWGLSPPRLLAVVGNHDLMSTGSLELQRRVVPRFVRNWDMPVDESPVVRELPGGLSLILLDSASPWGELEVRDLAMALQRARGPWRVIIGHRPPIAGHPQLSQMVARAAGESGRIVHAYLAGHVHALAAIPALAPAPALTVIAGSGARAKIQGATEYRIENADMIVEALGFVRVDLVSETPRPRLRVTLLRARPTALLAFLGSTRIAEYEIGLDGSVARADATR